MRGLGTEGSKAVGSVIRLASGLMKMFASDGNESCLAGRMTYLAVVLRVHGLLRLIQQTECWVANSSCSYSTN